MAIDPQLVALVVVTTGVGFVMAFAGVQKHTLEWRRRQRQCPSCGRLVRSCACT